MTTKAELDALRAELDALKTSMRPVDPAQAEREARAFRDEMHAMREARANAVPSWLVRETVGGVSDADAQDIARTRHAPTGPSSAGIVPSSQQLSNVRGTNAVRGTGWAREIPLSNPPGVALADKLMDEQDRRDRAELIERDARLKAMKKIAEGKS